LVLLYVRLFYYEAYQEDEIPYLDSKAVARTFEEMKQEYEGEYLLNQIKQFFDAYTLQSTKVKNSTNNISSDILNEDVVFF
jgi:hypothetical protein